MLMVVVVIGALIGLLVFVSIVLVVCFLETIKLIKENKEGYEL
jgi:hypothetical protein